MHLSCSGIVNYDFIRPTRLLLSLLVKEFWTSVKFGEVMSRGSVLVFASQGTYICEILTGVGLGRIEMDLKNSQFRSISCYITYMVLTKRVLRGNVGSGSALRMYQFCVQCTIHKYFPVQWFSCIRLFMISLIHSVTLTVTHRVGNGRVFGFSCATACCINASRGLLATAELLV